MRVLDFVEEVQDAPAAQRGHLLDLALGDLGERLRAVQDALDRAPVEVLDRQQVPHDANASSRLGDRDLVGAVDLADADVDALVARGRQVLADVVGADRQLAVAAVGQHGELHARGAPVVEQRLDRRAHRAAGVEHVVDEHDRVVLEPEAQVRRVDRGVDRPGGHVVAVERDVDVAERDLLVQQVADEPVQAGGEVRAAAVDAHEGDGAAVVLLDHLVRDAHERTADVVLVEDDLLIGQTVPSWPLGTGLKGLPVF